MTTINAAWFRTLMNDSSIAVATAEVVIQQAVDSLNTYGAGLSDLSGDAGSKTLSATSAQAGAIGLMTREIYSKLYKHASGSNVNVSTVGLSYSSDNQLLTFARALAFQLKTRSMERV